MNTSDNFTTRASRIDMLPIRMNVTRSDSYSSRFLFRVSMVSREVGARCASVVAFTSVSFLPRRNRHFTVPILSPRPRLDDNSIKPSRLVTSARTGVPTTHTTHLAHTHTH